MALIGCPECGKEMSSAAKACPHCGFPIQTGHEARAEQETSQKKGMSGFRKFLLACAGLVIAFLIFGALIPENVAEANAAYRACKEMHEKGLVLSLHECERQAAEIRNRGK